MTSRSFCSLLAGMFVLCATQIASSAPITYVETIDGDLPAVPVGSLLPVLAFDVGVNSISGVFGNDGAIIDFDSFAFTVPTGSRLTAGQVSLVDVLGNILGSSWRLGAGTANSSGGPMLEFFAAGSPGLGTLTSTPLAPNVYNLTHLSFTSVGPTPKSSAYTFTFLVAVPEPSSALLLLIGAAKLLRCRSKCQIDTHFARALQEF